MWSNRSSTVAAATLTAVFVAICVYARQPGSETTEFLFSEGFESGPDPVEFWLSYEKAYTVNFKGLTDERVHTGSRAFKLDVTFNESSRFLWRIPLTPPLPVGGELSFSAFALIGENTTGSATLGVAMALPPTHHTGCTAPSTFLTDTDGQWYELRENVAGRARGVAQTVTGHYQAGVRGDNVAPVVESIIFDLRGDAGQRVVLYVDDVELRGIVPTAAAHRAEIVRRWAPVEAALEPQLSRWEAAIGDAVVALEALRGLSPKAERLRDGLLTEAADRRQALAAIRQRGYLNIAEPSSFDGFLSTLPQAAANIRAISAAERADAPILVTVTPPISAVQILPSEQSLPGEVGADITVTAARGEYEPASVVVTALQDLDSLGASATPLTSDSGTIPGSAVDIRFVKCWYQAGTAWSGIRQDRSTRLLTPELLLKDDALVRVDEQKKENYLKLRRPGGDEYIWISDPTEVRKARPWSLDQYPIRDSDLLQPIALRANRNKQVWLTVHVPEGAAPGLYTGHVLLHTADRTVARIPLRLTVLPFELLSPCYTSSMDYHGRLDPSGKGSIGSWVKTPEQFRNELANMVAHGLRNCQHYSIRKEILADALRIRAEVGMDNTTLYLKNTIPVGNPTDPEALAKIKHDVRDIIEFVKPFGTETVYFYGIDEQRGEKLAAQRPAWNAVREAGGKIFVAGWGDNIELMGDIQDMHVRAGPPSRDEVDRWHAYGHRIFCYSNPQTGVENPVVYRRNYGLLLWKFDYDGAATNAYQHTFGATWNDFDHNVYRAHTIAYPTANGVIDTIAWEGYREGVDDVRYVTTLEKAVETESRSAAQEKAAAAARAFLRRLKTSREVETGDLDAIREAIIRHLLELHRAAGGG